MQSRATNIGQGRILPLDGLRGIAALAVVAFHFQDIYLHDSTVFIPGGYLAVDLFFLISGVVLTHVYEEKIQSGAIDFREFFLHRFARLYPLHFFVLAGILAVDLLSHRFFPQVLHSQNGHFAVADPPLLTGLLNFLCLQSVGFNGALPWNLPSWSISVEIAVNFIWFWMLLRWRGSAPFVALVVLAGLILTNNAGTVDAWTRNAYGIVNLGLTRGLFGFLLGCLLYRHVIRAPGSSRLGAAGANALAATALLLACLALRYANTGPESTGIDYIAVVIAFPALILAGLHPATFLNRLLVWKPALWLGEISYSIYLLHWIMLRLLSRMGERLPVPVYAAVFLALVLLCSWTTYTLVEQPCRRRVRAWFSRRSEPAPMRSPLCDGEEPADLSGRRSVFR